MTTLIQTEPIIKSKSEIDQFLSGLISGQSETEKKLSSHHRKMNGVFLTSNYSIVEDILNIIEINQDIIDKKILEPSCGHGIFLLTLIERVYLKFPDENYINKLIENTLIFNDIDPTMVTVTKSNIRKFYQFLFDKRYEGAFNTFVSDFTLRNNMASGLFEENVSNPLEGFIGKIDYVVGNPPYVTLYGRRDKKKSEEQRVAILNSYSQFPAHVKNGKINYVMLFIEQALDLMGNGGKLAFIIDISFFETAYQYTRKFLLEKTNILSLGINLASFDVGSGQLIIKLEKTSPSKDSVVEIYNHSNDEVSRVQQIDWFNPEDEFKFRINSCNVTEKIIKKINKANCRSIKEQFPKKNLRTCVMLLNMEDKFTSKNKNFFADFEYYPYYQGSKSLKEKFGELSFEKYFFYNRDLQNKINDELKEQLSREGVKNKKRLGLGEKDIYENPKVYIRQSAKEIIAIYDEKRSSANNSLYVFSLRNNANETKQYLKFICGYLNSQLITFYCQKRNIIRFCKGKQPQIKISDLSSVPLPSEKSLIDKVARIVTTIMEFPKSKNQYCRDLNDAVYDFYGIAESDRSFIEKEIKNF